MGTGHRSEATPPPWAPEALDGRKWQRARQQKARQCREGLVSFLPLRSSFASLPSVQRNGKRNSRMTPAEPSPVKIPKCKGHGEDAWSMLTPMPSVLLNPPPLAESGVGQE